MTSARHGYVGGQWVNIMKISFASQKINLVLQVQAIRSAFNQVKKGVV